MSRDQGLSPLPGTTPRQIADDPAPGAFGTGAVTAQEFDYWSEPKPKRLNAKLGGPLFDRSRSSRSRAATGAAKRRLRPFG
jgi:hypothetical protein